jgi:iron complex transport system substrate-binding protein
LLFKNLIFFIFGIMVIIAAPPAWTKTGEMAFIGKNGIRDCAGREIYVEKPFSRIISLYGAHTENLFALGLAEEIIGVSRNDDYPKSVLRKAKFSSHDGPEKFLAVCPDLVLVRPMIDRGYAPLMQRLEEFGICVVSLQPGNVKEMKTYWQILGRLTGCTDAAAAMILKFDKGVQQARQMATQILKKKYVYFEAIHDKFKTFSPGAMPLFALACAGGRNVAENVRPVRGTNIAAFGKEQIMETGPKIDVYLAQKGPMNPVSAKDIANEPGYKVIKAVREGQVYMVEEQIVSRPTLRLLKGICKIGEILYPEVYTRKAQQGICNPSPL